MSKPFCPSSSTLTLPVRPYGPLTTPEATEESPRRPGPSSLLLPCSLCGLSPSSLQVSAGVSCPLLPSYSCIPLWYRGPCCGGLIPCSGCRHPELPTRSRDLPFGSWGVVFSVGGATFVSLSGMILPVHLTVINYKIFRNLLLLDNRFPVLNSE